MELNTIIDEAILRNASDIHIAAGSPDGAAHFRSEEPVQQGNQHHQNDTHGNQRVVQSKFLDPTQRNEQIRLVYIY